MRQFRSASVISSISLRRLIDIYRRELLWSSRNQSQRLWRLKQGGLTNEYEGATQDPSPDRDGEQAKADQMEGGEEMRYLVVARWKRHSGEWKTISKGFDDDASAKAFADSLYNSDACLEICVLLYELKQSWN